MLVLNYCLVKLNHLRGYAVLWQVESQKVRNDDEDGSTVLFDEGGLDVVSCGEPDLECDTLYVRGMRPEMDNKIVIVNPTDWKRIVQAVWKYNITSSHNTLSPDDVFINTGDLLLGRDDVDTKYKLPVDPTEGYCREIVKDE
jgi:hypothetical protein